DAVDSDRAFLDIVETQQKRDERGLAGAGVADYGYGFAGFDGEGYVAENPVERDRRRPFGSGTGRSARPHTGFILHMVLAGFKLAVGEPDVVEFDATSAFGALRHSGRDYLHGRVQQLENALAGGHGRLQDVVFFAEVHDWTEKPQSVLDEGDQHAQRRHRRHQAKCNQRLPVETYCDAGHGSVAHYVAAAEPDDAGNGNR